MIYVLGMHRSGTSAVTRAINLLGPVVGPVESLIPPTPNNPKGYWERVDVYRLNERILNDHAGSWASPPRLPDRWDSSEAMRRHLDAIESIVAALVSDPSAVFLLKDPRFCFTLPLWARVVAPSRVLLVVRHPRAVCRSLQRRNAMSTDEAADLWIRYNRSGLQVAPDSLVVSFDALLADPRPVLAELADQLGLAPGEGSLERAVASLDAALDHGEEAVADGPHPESEAGEAPHPLALATESYRALCRGERAVAVRILDAEPR